MNRPDAILFDLDGTLLDTARDLGNALNFVLREHGLPEKHYSDYRPVASHGSQGLLELGFGDALDNYDVEILRTRLLDYYFEHICTDTVPFDGIEALIACMDARSLPWGIVTNKPGWLTNALVPEFKAFEHCGVTVSGDTLKTRKPHPEPLLHAAKHLGVAAQKVWYVGDAERDIQSANRAGMLSIVAEYGYIDGSEDPGEWHADLHVAHADDLLSLLQSTL